MTEYVRDTFDRSVSSGWGTSDVGGAWTTEFGASVFMRVTGARAQVDFKDTSSGSGYGRLPYAQPALDVHGAMRLRPTDVALGTSGYFWFRVTGTGSTFGGYGIRLGRNATTGAVIGEIVRGTASAPVVIGTMPTPPTWSSVTTYWWAELEVTGVSPTTIRARWFSSSAIPTDDTGWTEVTDSTGPQAVGVYGYRGTRSAGTYASQFVIAMHAAAPLVPAFTVSFDVDGLTAHFVSTVLTGGDPVAHWWDFGDGTQVFATDPVKHYLGPGSYSVIYVAVTRWGTQRGIVQTVVVPGPGAELPPVRPSVYIGGEDVCDRVFAASWSRGRERWPDDTLGSTLTLSLRGRLSDVNMGTPVVVALPPGAPDGTLPLFTGEVDQVTESVDPVEAKTTTQLVAMDVAAFLGRWHILPASTFASGGLPARVADLAPRASTTYRAKWAGVSAGRWPTLKALSFAPDKLRQKTYLDMLRDGLRASLATAYVAPDNAIVYAPLDPPAGLSVSILDLDTTGPDCPDHMDNERSTAEGMVNRWTVGDGSVVDRVERPSIEAYGESVWSVATGVLATESTFPITTPIAEQMREPFPAKTVSIPIRDWAARAFLSEPLDMASMEGQLYGILGVRHTVGIHDWTVVLTLDRDPWSMTGATPPAPPAAHTTTQTFKASKDTMLASPSMGAGRSTRLPVGLWDGTKYRALVQFDLDWDHPPRHVVTADLLLETAGQDAVGYGGSPEVHIDRITGPWSEGGSGGNGPPWTYSSENAVVYPGPAVTTAGRRTASVTGATNASETISLTNIVRAWADGANNRGIRIISTNESSTGKTTEFYSSEYATDIKRPRLRVTYEW